MPKYQMPDGQEYEFQDDNEATKALNAWQQQFGSEQKKSSILEDIGAGITRTLGTASSGIGLVQEALGNVLSGASESPSVSRWTPKEELNIPSNIDKTIEGINRRSEYWKEQDPTIGKQQGAGKIISALAGLPAYLSPPGLATMIAGSVRDRGTDILNEAPSELPSALGAAGSELAMQGLGAAIPVGLVAGKVKNALAGAGAGAGQAIAGHEIQSAIRENAGLKPLQPMDVYDVASAAIPGAGMGAMFAKQAKLKPKTVDPIQEKIDAEIEAAKQKESTSGYPKLNEEPITIPGSTIESEVRPIDQFQGPGAEHLGIKPEESTPLPVFPEQLKPLSEQYPQGVDIGVIEAGGKVEPKTSLPEIPKQESGLLSLEEPTTEAKTKEPLPNLEGVDFSLRQEVLQQPEISSAIDNFRTEAARLQAIIDQYKSGTKKQRAIADLEALKQEFGAGMKQLGIDNASEAHGLNRPLYDSGVETKLPIEKTVSATERLKGDVGKVIDAIAEGIGTKQNFMPGEGLHKALVDLSHSLWDAGHQTFLKASAEARKMLGEAWKDVAPYFKQAWDYARSIQPGLSIKGDTKKAIVPTFTEFATKYKAPQDILAKVYEDTYGVKPSVEDVIKTNPVLEAQQTEAQKTILMGGKYAGDVIPPEQFIPAVKGLPDIEPSLGILGKMKFSSGSRVLKEALDHPVTTQIFNIVTKAIENSRLTVDKTVLDSKSGFMPILHKHVMFAKDGYTSFKEYFKWRYENEGLDTPLPDTFSPSIKKFHELETQASSKLWDAMNTVRPNSVTARAKELSNHLAHLWDGPYRFYIKAKDANGVERIITYIAEKNIQNAKKAAEYYKEHFPEYTQTEVTFVPGRARLDSLGKKIEQNDFQKSPDPSRYDHLLDIANTQDPIVIEALNNLARGMEAKKEQYRQAHQRFEVRSGKEGYLGNKPWLSEKENYADTLQSIKTKYSAGYDWVALQETKQQMKPIIDAHIAGEINFPKAIGLGEQFLDHAFGRRAEDNPITKTFDAIEGVSPRFGSATRTTLREANNIIGRITIPYLLAGKASTIVQAVAQPMITIPRLMKLQNEMGGSGYTDIATAYAHGTMDGLFRFMDSISMGKTSKLTDAFSSDLTKAIRNEIEARDIAKVALVEDKPLFGEGGRLTTIGNTAASLAGNSLLGMFEGPTRAWAFSTYTRKFVADGKPIKEALNMAHEQMDTMVNYNPEASPMIFSELGIAGDQAKGLHTFLVNYYSVLGNYVGDAVAGLKKGNVKETAPLATYLLQTFTMAGLAGFVGMDFVEWVSSLIQSAVRGTSIDSEKIQEFTPRKWLLENYPDAAVGPFAVATNRTTYGYFASKIVDPSRSFLENVFPKTAAGIEIAKGVVQLPFLAKSDITDIEKGNILEKALPKAFTPTIREKYSEKDNTVFHRTGRNIGQGQYIRTPEEARIAKEGYGLKSLSEGLKVEQLNMKQQAENRIEDAINKRLTSFDTKVRASITNNKYDPQIDKLITDLSDKWGVDPNSMGKRLRKIYTDYGLGEEQIRNLVTQSKVRSIRQLHKLERTQELQNQFQQRNQQQ